jgi:hypothetical protein
MFDEDQLDPAERELETALRSLRPTPARLDRVAVVSADCRTARSRWWIGSIAAAAAVIVVGGGAWLALSPSGQISESPDRRVAVNEHLHAPAREIPVEPPTLLAYRRALARSSAELEALLDRQATMGMPPANSVVMLNPWNTDLHSSSGEM